MVNILFRNFYYKIFACHKYGHGIHSPFVYDFVRNVLNSENLDFNDLNSIKSSILNDYSFINSSIYNTNSKLSLNSKKISVKKFLNYASLPKKYGCLLNKIVKYYNICYVVELGTGLGISSYYILYENKNTILYTIEGNNEMAKISYEVLYGNGFKNFKLYNCSFKEGLDLILPIVKDKNKVLFFIDGDHRGENLKNYIDIMLNNIGNEIFIVVDDIRWSVDMYRAWKEIIKDNRIKISIDIGRMGILLKKDQIYKQHFMIRF